ncbi:hypothetical protein C2845_PM03G07840 [Panicum miliaceum]|uniref:Uncharacterized protein n=1 Tax=Panicum miliaceum TaxID=4540 RepID=A0A3L6TA56_PANMI|nr:hypothetical protein C2845_PM03G07840 [Panicum miliaceum]
MVAAWRTGKVTRSQGTPAQGVREAVVVVPHQESTGVAPWPHTRAITRHQPPASADPCPPRRASLCAGLYRALRWAGAIPHSLRCFCVAHTTGANRGQSPSPVASQPQQAVNGDDDDEAATIPRRTEKQPLCYHFWNSVLNWGNPFQILQSFQQQLQVLFFVEIIILIPWRIWTIRNGYIFNNVRRR